MYSNEVRVRAVWLCINFRSRGRSLGTSDFIITDVLTAGCLATLLLKRQLASSRVHAVWPENADRRQIGQRFVGLLKARLA